MEIKINTIPKKKKSFDESKFRYIPDHEFPDDLNLCLYSDPVETAKRFEAYYELLNAKYKIMESNPTIDADELKKMASDPNSNFKNTLTLPDDKLTKALEKFVFSKESVFKGYHDLRSRFFRYVASKISNEGFDEKDIEDVSKDCKDRKIPFPEKELTSWLVKVEEEEYMKKVEPDEWKKIQEEKEKKKVPFKKKALYAGIKGLKYLLSAE